MNRKLRRKKWQNLDTDGLFGAILLLRNVGEARRFFRDLLTEQEIIEFGQRWKVARLLSRDVPYARIVRETGMSSTTVARVQRWLRRGMGGYRLVLKRLGNKE